MSNKSIINNVFKIAIKSWLKTICTNINIKDLKFNLNKNFFGKVDKIYLEAENIIFKGLFINKIIIKIYDCNLKFNYRNNLIYSEDLIIKSFLTIDKKNLEKNFFSIKWKNLRTEIEEVFLEFQSPSDLFINNDLIFFRYDINKIKKQIILSLNLKENLIFLEDINHTKRLSFPEDKNIKFNKCIIKNEQININLTSKIIFDN